MYDISQNLDALHDHLATIYPGMRAPSFRVTERADGALILHYTSERKGLEHVVIGMVRTVAKKLHNRNVKVLWHSYDVSFFPGTRGWEGLTKYFVPCSGPCNC